MKFPKQVTKVIEHYLPVNVSYRHGAPAPAPEPGKEYTIDELSREAGVTARNIRAYQDKGILSPPLIRGRTGIYSNDHLSRLRMIISLLDRGYTAASIRELLHGIEEGVGIEELIGVENAVVSPWSSEEPVIVGMPELGLMFGNSLTPEAVMKAVELGLFKLEGSDVRVTSMSTLKAGAELTKLGIPLLDMLEIVSMMRGNVERVANEMVKLVADNVLEPFDAGEVPPKEELPRIAELIWRLRPLAEIAVKAELARAMEKAATQFLADKLEMIMQNISTEPPSGTKPPDSE